MTGASLGYDGNYANLLLYNVGLTSNWRSSTVNSTSTGYRLNTHYTDAITPQNSSNKYDGLAVRCAPNLAYQSGDATQSEPDALISGVRLNQA